MFCFIQRSYFALKLLVLLAYDHRVGWPTRMSYDIVFFFVKKAVGHMTFAGQLTVLIYDHLLPVMDFMAR